jgi:hypothetical protein
MAWLVRLCESDSVHIGFQELEVYSRSDVLTLLSQSRDDTYQKARPSSGPSLQSALNASHITITELQYPGSCSFQFFRDIFVD